MIKESQPELERSEIIEALPEACADEAAAVEFFEAQRWGNSPACPHCSKPDVYKMTDRKGARNKRFLWRCRACGEQFTVRIGTVFEESRLPLKHWAYAFWRASTSKKGVAALEIQRQCQITYKSALFLMHRIRFAMTDDPETPRTKFGGTTEIDEVYIGGKPRYELGKKNKRGRGTDKTPVVAMVQRDGEVRTKVIVGVNSKNLHQFVNATIDKASTVNTDQSCIYHNLLYPWARHDVVNHSKKEYARHNLDGTVSHVNTCESFFSLLKRGINGIFHSVSREHLHRYCDEFGFRWNTRRFSDGERVVAAIKGSVGKRLVYREKQSR